MTHMAPNGTSSLLDLSLYSADFLSKISYTVDAVLCDSDHFPVQLTTALTRPYLRSRTHYRWRSIIGEVNLALLAVDNIDYESFLFVTQTAMIRHKESTHDSNRGFPAWWSTRCTNLRHLKRFYLKRAQRNASIQDWISYKRFAAKLRIVIKAEKRRFWDTVYKDAGDPRLLHRVFRKIRTRIQDVPDSNFCIQGSGG